jgi:hypothetical protein
MPLARWVTHNLLRARGIISRDSPPTPPAPQRAKGKGKGKRFQIIIYAERRNGGHPRANKASLTRPCSLPRADLTDTGKGKGKGRALAARPPPCPDVLTNTPAAVTPDGRGHQDHAP